MKVKRQVFRHRSLQSTNTVTGEIISSMHYAVYKSEMVIQLLIVAL